MCEPYKTYSEVSSDEANPGGLDALENPHSFSSNPGFISPMTFNVGPATGGATSGMGGMRTPVMQSGSTGWRVTPVVGSGNTVGRSANRGFGSVANAAPGSVDPSSDGGPLTRTGGYSG